MLLVKIWEFKNNLTMDNNMNCKISLENIELERKLNHQVKQTEEWKDLYKRNEEMNREWCDQLRTVLNDLGYIEDPDLDTALRRALDELVSLRKQLGKDTSHLKEGMCSNTHCKRYTSSIWKFCPECGRQLGEKIKVETTDLISKIEKDNQIPENTQDPKYLFVWRCRWTRIKKYLIEGV